MGSKILTTDRQQLIALAIALPLGLAAWLGAPAIAAAATLTLSPSTGSYAAGASFEVKILLDTQGKTTSGTDVYLRFDPNILQVVDANAATEGIQIQPGSLYPVTNANSTDNSAGKVSFSGSRSTGTAGYSGSGTLATITFQAQKEATSSSVTFDFTKSTGTTQSTADSNVIEQTTTKDILTSVTDGQYGVTAAAAAGTGSTGTGTGSTGTGTTGSSGTGTAGSGSTGGGSTTGASGQAGDSGTGGSGTVAATGIDLDLYMALTLISLFGAGYFLFRRARP